MTNNIKKKNSKRLIVLLILLCVYIFIMGPFSSHVYSLNQELSHKPESILKYCQSSEQYLSAEDYDTIFHQTGLGKMAVDELMNRGEMSELIDYQSDFFENKNVKREKLSPFTSEETLCDEQGNEITGFQIASIMDGDILISKNTQTLGWQHGHAAIVTNAEKKETMEAISLGINSSLQSIDKWRKYPQFIQLRMKGNVGQKAGQYARDNLEDVPYGLFASIREFQSPSDILKTQCAHLVWAAYKSQGYDINSDGYWLVTPKDIANSPLLEVVQVFGVDTENIWD